MISDYDKERILQAVDLRELAVSLGLELRRAGVNYTCCCPLHKEKTPSFVIHTNKQRWKCYGCGQSGDAISLVQKLKGYGFVEALTFLAQKCGIQIEQQQETEDQRKARSLRRALRDVNAMAAEWFAEQLKKNQLAQDYTAQRWRPETIEDFGIGYAPDDFGALYSYLHTKMGVKSEVLHESPLFKRSERNGGLYSFYRDRIMFPFHSTSHEVVGFTGRILGATDAGKYINSPSDEKAVFSKKQFLYLWDRAFNAASREDCVIIVEGNPDAIRLHEIGIDNVVAVSGKEFCEEQAEMIKRVTSNVYLLLDGDKAGRAGLVTVGKRCMNWGLSPYVLPFEVGDEKVDPDEYFKPECYQTAQGDEWVRVKAAAAAKFKTFFHQVNTPFLTYYANLHKEACRKDPIKASQIMNEICAMLVSRQKSVQIAYMTELCSIIGNKKTWETCMEEHRKIYEAEMRAANQKEEEEQSEDGLTDEQRRDILEYGCFVRENCYWIASNPKATGKQVSNFVLRPHFLIEDYSDGKRLYTLVHKDKNVLDKEIEMKVSDSISLSSVRKIIESVGKGFFRGKQEDWDKIREMINSKMVTCREITRLGWQPEGFFAWCNGIIAPGINFTPTDNEGIVLYNKAYYYIPGLSSFKIDDRSLFVYERDFVHQDNGANLFTLADKMHSAYGTNGIVGVCYYLAAVHRDIIYNMFKCFPLLNVFGPKGTGKSQMAQTMVKLFGTHKKGTNLFATSPAALADQISKCRNGLIHIDEYKNDAGPEKVEVLKGIYDGVGRSRMNMDKDKKREMIPVDTGVIVTGQEMMSVDDALFSRVIFLTFSKTHFSPEEKVCFNDLKEYEGRGLTAITNELISHREIFAQRFAFHYDEAMKEISQLVNISEAINDRTLQNWLILLASARTLLKEGRITLPYSYEEICDIVAEGMQHQDDSVNKESDVADFWKHFKTLIVNGDIEEGADYCIYMGKVGQKLDRAGPINTPMDILYLNPDRVFAKYQELKNKVRDGKERKIHNSSIIYYIKNSPMYLGQLSHRFAKSTEAKRKTGDFGMESQDMIREAKGSVNTKAWVLDYGYIQKTFDVDFGEGGVVVMPAGEVDNFLNESTPY